MASIEIDHIPPNWILLAEVDESTGYDVDITGVYKDIGSETFFFVTATGCSCWAGERWIEGTFESVEDLFKFLHSEEAEEMKYHPSRNGVTLLLAQLTEKGY